MSCFTWYIYFLHIYFNFFLLLLLFYQKHYRKKTRMFFNVSVNTSSYISLYLYLNVFVLTVSNILISTYFMLFISFRMKTCDLIFAENIIYQVFFPLINFLKYFMCFSHFFKMLCIKSYVC